MKDDVILHTHTQLVAAHSYDAEMNAVHHAIEYITISLTGRVIVFIDNQSTIHSILNVKAHSLFELSRKNNHFLWHWIDSNVNNNIKFCWVPSHLGFCINKLADSAANSPHILLLLTPHLLGCASTKAKLFQNGAPNGLFLLPLKA